MKKGMMLIVFMLFSMIGPLSAAIFQGGEVIRVAEGDTLPDDLFGAGRSLYIEGIVQGDVYGTGERLTVTGQVEDDVLAFCRHLRIQGTVKGQVLFFGESVIVDGEIYGDLLAFGRTVELTDNALVHGNVMVGCGYLNLTGGQILGSVQGGSGKAFLNSQVGKQVSLKIKHIRFGDNYFAGETTSLTLPEELDETKAGPLPDNLQVTITPPKRFYQKRYFYWSMVAMFVTGLILIAFARYFVQDLIAQSFAQPLKNLGVGAIGLIGIPIAVVLLLILIFTIPVSLILLALYLIIFYLSYIFTAFSVGNYLYTRATSNGKTGSLILSLLIGILLVSLLPHVPAIGWLFKLGIVCFGMGSLLIYLWKIRKTENTALA